MGKKYIAKKLKKKDIKKMLNKIEIKAEKRISKALKMQKEKHDKHIKKVLRKHIEKPYKQDRATQEKIPNNSVETVIEKKVANFTQWG